MFELSGGENMNEKSGLIYCEKWERFWDNLNETLILIICEKQEKYFLNTF